MLKITVYMSKREWEMLHQAAERDLRGMREHARYLIRRGLGMGDLMDDEFISFSGKQDESSDNSGCKK